MFFFHFNRSHSSYFIFLTFLPFPKLTVFKDQNSQLLQEFASLSQQLGEAQEEYGLLEHHLNRLLGEPVALETVTIDECEELEKSLKTALERIETKKVAILMLSSLLTAFHFK